MKLINISPQVTNANEKFGTVNTAHFWRDHVEQCLNIFKENSLKLYHFRETYLRPIDDELPVDVENVAVEVWDDQVKKIMDASQKMIDDNEQVVLLLQMAFENKRYQPYTEVETLPKTAKTT